MSWELRRAEQYALGGTAVAFALTAWLAGSGLAIESNPVVAAVISRLGWMGAGVLAIGIEAAIFAGYRRLEPQYQGLMRAGGWLLAAVGVGDVAVNLWLLKQVGRPETYHWHKWLPVLAVVGGAALLALWRPDPRALARRVPEPTQAHRRVAAAVAIACLMALSGVPPSAFGPGAPGETVESAMGAGTDEWIYVAEGNGDAEKTDGDTIDWTESVGANGVEGVSVGPNTDWVYAVDIDGTLERIDEADGTSDWTKSFDSTTHADVSAGPNGNWAYYTSASGNFLARVHASNGTDDWNVTMEHTARDVVAQRANSNWVYVADSSGGSTTSELKRIHANNGSTDWSYTAPEDFITAIDTSPDGDTVYATSEAEGEVHAVHESNGTQKWVANVATEQMNGLAAGVNGDFVYAAADDDGGNTFTFYKIHASNGTEALSTTKSANDEALAAGSQGTYIYAGRGSSDLVGVFTENGTDDWTQNLGADVNHLSTSGYFDEGGTAGGDPPYVKTAIPSGDEYVNSSDRQISLDAKVKDPEGDPIDVTVYHNPLNGSGWLQVNSTTDTSSGSWVNTTVTADDGANRWKVKTDDDVNAAENSTVYEFRVGGLFTIFNGTDLTLANQTTISAEFTSQDSNFTTSKSTTDGKMELTGLPDETLEAELSGSGYENATIIVDDVTDPYFPILYEGSASATFSRCFELDDETGQFPPSESWIILEAYVDGDWEHVASDKFGAINNATVTIQDGEDYRVKIKNEDDDIRSAGSFTADSSFSGCRTITLQAPSDDGGGTGLDDADDGTIDGDYEWDAYLDSQDDIFWYLHLGPNSSADSLNVTIWEYQNKSNELTDLEFGERGLGANTTHTEPLTSDQANDTWVVKWNGTINGEQQSGKRIVGKSEAALGGGFTTTQDKLPNWFKALVSIGSIFVVAGLFSQLNGDVGALAVAGMGGMWFFIGWLPADVGSGVVVLAMVAAGAIFINERRTSSV